MVAADIRGWVRTLRRLLRRGQRWILWRQEFLWLRAQLAIEVMEEVQAPEGVVIQQYDFETRQRFLTAVSSDIAGRLARLWEALPKSWVFAVELNSVTVAYYCFVSVGKVWIEELGTQWSFAPGQAYVHTCYAMPGYRGCGFHSMAMRYVHSWLARRGFREAFALVASGNTPSLRGFQRAGFAVAGCVVHWHFLGRVYRRAQLYGKGQANG